MEEAEFLLRGTSDEFESEKPILITNTNHHAQTSTVIYSHYIIKLVFSFITFLIPSFLRRTAPKARSEMLRPTACLDGLRGLAAFLVMNFHYTGAFYQQNFGYVPETQYAHFINLPFVKILYAGLPMVAIFFVISGYVLSYKSLLLTRKGDWAAVQHNMSSSVFRRAMRLYIPAIVSMALITLTVWLGLWEPARRECERILPLEYQYWPPRWDSPTEHVKFWAMGVFQLANAWQGWGEHYPRAFDGNLWTISQEFRGSMALFLVALGILRIKTSIMRRAVLAGVIAWVVACQRWDVVLFLSGMFMAETDLESTKPVSRLIANQIPEDEKPQVRSKSYRIVWTGILVLAVYLCSSPVLSLDQAWGYHYVSKVAPLVYWESWRVPQHVGAILFVAAATRVEVFTTFLTTPTVQYLGKISYAFYICHGPLIRTTAFWAVPKLWKFTGTGNYGYALALGLWWVVYVPLVVICADVFWRLVDVPSVNLSRWVESKCFVGPS